MGSCHSDVFPFGCKPPWWVRVNLRMCVRKSIQPEWLDAPLFLPGSKRNGDGGRIYAKVDLSLVKPM